MLDINWYSIHDLYTIEKYKIRHNKNPATKWIRLPCVYKIKINNKIVEENYSKNPSSKATPKVVPTPMTFAP